MKPGAMPVRLIVSCVLLLQVLHTPTVAAVINGVVDVRSSAQCSRSYASMNATYENRYGVDVVWDIPLKPKAVLFLAHGGTKDAVGYFDPGPHCEPCYGLPEGRTVVLEALRRGYAVIAVKSIGPRYDTKGPILDESKDLMIATNVIKEWTSEHALDDLPLVAWGHSSGTNFTSALPTRFRMAAVVFTCGQGMAEVLERAIPLHFPPVFFAYMPTDWDDPDINVTGEVFEPIALLKGLGVEVAEAQCWPKPLYPLFFTERIVCMSDEMSQKVFAAYEAAGWVDRKGYLRINPSREDWKAVLLEANALPYCQESGDLCFAVHVEEELKMAFAEHSFTSDANDSIFPWLDSKILSSSDLISTW